MGKRHQITAAEMRKAVKKLRAADAKRKCYFCKKLNPDGFAMVPVSIHMVCGDKAEKKMEQLTRIWSLQYQNKPTKAKR